MKETNHDDDLRRMLRDLGRDAEHRAPSFQHVWKAACEKHAAGGLDAGRCVMKWAFAVAAMIVVGGLTVLLLTQHPRTEAVVNLTKDALQTAMAGTDNFDPSTPTDFLLTANGDATAPSVGQLTREINALLNP